MKYVSKISLKQHKYKNTIKISIFATFQQPYPFFRLLSLINVLLIGIHIQLPWFN